MIANFQYVKICFEFIYNSHEWCRICLNIGQFLLIDFIRFSTFCWLSNVELLYKWIYIPKNNSCRINRMVNKFLIAYTLRFPRWMRSKFDARGFVRWPVGSIYTFLLIFSYKHTCVHNKKFKHWNNRFHSIQSTFFPRGFWSFPLFQLLYVFFFVPNCWRFNERLNKRLREKNNGIIPTTSKYNKANIFGSLIQCIMDQNSVLILVPACLQWLVCCKTQVTCL